MWKYIGTVIRKGVKNMTALITSMKKSLLDHSSLFSIFPATDYNKHVPQNSEKLMRENWQKTGESLYSAMYKVGEEIENGCKECKEKEE